MSDITTDLTRASTVVGSVSQGNQPQVVRVTVGSGSSVGSISNPNQAEVVRVSVPGPKGDTGLAGAAQNAIGQATDVDITSFPLQDGSLLQYRASTGKWTARNELDTTTGNLVLSGGSF
jgi:hypothetical protein